MNKKLSIIMLLSCVGNVFSMSGKESKSKTTKEKLKELPGEIYLSTADFAGSKTGAFIASAACTAGGFQLVKLPASQNALDTAKELLMSSKEIGYVYACKAGSATCSFLSKVGSDLAKVGSNTLSKASSVSREAVEFIAQHKVDACLVAATVGGAAYGLYKYKETTAATKQAESAKRKLQKDEDALSSSKFAVGGESELVSKLNQNIKLLASSNLKDYQGFVDMLLQSDFENNLLHYDHVKDDRTLLMLLSEANDPSIRTTNLAALRYWKKTIDDLNLKNPSKRKYIAVNKLDKHGRTALFYAAHYGLEGIVDFLIDVLNADVSPKDVASANYKVYAGTTEGGCARIKAKLEAKLAIQ